RTRPSQDPQPQPLQTGYQHIASTGQPRQKQRHWPERRGGTPIGLHAIDAVHEGDFGKMVALRGTDIVHVPIAEATARLKTVDPKLYAEVGVFFG
ncbi:hypothetical protein PV408_43690, partial [Streptomyces sp. ME18-1-4]|nr:hypothetical protein [Streptomyces sp. ME18-1-4]